MLIVRGIHINSYRLGVSGICDVVEFHGDELGIHINSYEGLWTPFPVEYKLGQPKENNCDAAQLCAQAICLEEMLCCEIPRGALFYGRPKRRFLVEFTEELRQQVQLALKEMHALFKRGHTPMVKRSKACNACSLKELCLPSLMQKRSVKKYMEDRL